MTTATMPRTERPLPSIPSGAHKSDIWKDREGVLQKHPIELPVDKDTNKINGMLFACVIAACNTAEWVIAPKTEPKTRHCPNDGQLLALVPLDDTEDDPIATGRQRQLAWIANRWAQKRQDYAERVRASSAMTAVRDTRMAAPEKLAQLATDSKGHLASLAATTAVEVGVIYTVEMTSALETAALAVTITTAGIIAGYLLAVYVEKIRLHWRKEGFEGRAARKARERGLWAGRAAISTGLFLTVTGLIEGLAGLDAGSPVQWAVLSLLGLGLAWWTNGPHWAQLWAERRRVRQLALDKARRAAEAEALRAEQDAARLLQEAQLLARLAEVGAYDEDNPQHQGERMRIEWERISRLPTMRENFPQIEKTRIDPAQTREITAPDPHTGKLVRIGWEYLGIAEPGALVGRGGMGSPLQAAKDWLVAVLFDGKFEPSAISLIDNPDNRQNTFMVMITERARLGDPVLYRAETAVRIDPDGTRYGYLGRSLTGEELMETLYKETQPFGGGVVGTTGGGKGCDAIRHLCSSLLAAIFPIVVDPKRLVDYADFAGLFPIGFTRRHRRMILEFLHRERQRRETKLAAAPKTNRYGAKVTGESRWNTHDPQTGEIGPYGQPILHLWDEFHDQAKDPAFLADFANLVRLQRAVAMGAKLLSQGGGLSDFGDSTLRDLVNQTSLTMYRTGELSSRLAGGRNQNYSTADLPKLPGMCLRQAGDTPQIPLRAAYITRDADAEDTVYTLLWGKGAEPVLQIEDPLTWIADETVEIMKETGVWDLWMLARDYNPDGTFRPNIDRLLADDQEDEDEETGMEITLVRPKAVQPAMPAAPQGRMFVRDVVLAILHEHPGISRKEIDTSEVWERAPGWGRPPAASSITRAADELDPTVAGTKPLSADAVQKIDRGPNSGSWTLTAAGTEQGARAASRLIRRPDGMRNEPGLPPAAGPEGGASTTQIAENAVLRAAELAQQLAEEAALAGRADSRGMSL
jgi:hypothetical protein